VRRLKIPIDVRPAARPRRPAFTLVELLVVIGIVAVLIAILLPVLRKAQEQARQAVCASNQRQICMAALQYANQNQGWLPRIDDPYLNFNQPSQGVIQFQPPRAWIDFTRGELMPYVGKDPAMDFVFSRERKRVECAARRRQQQTRSEPGHRDRLHDDAGAEPLQRIAYSKGGACADDPERRTQRDAGGVTGALRQEAGRLPCSDQDKEQQRSGEHGDGAVERPARPYQAGRRQCRAQYCNAGGRQGAGCRP